MPINTAELLTPAQNPELNQPTLEVDAAGLPVINGDGAKASALRFLAENWRKITNVDALADRVDVPEQARGLKHGEQLFATGYASQGENGESLGYTGSLEQVLYAIDQRCSPGLENRRAATIDARTGNIMDPGNEAPIREADEKIQREIAKLFEPNFLRTCNLTADEAKQLLTGVLTDLMWDDMGTVILPVSDAAAEAISITHRLNYQRAHQALHPNEARLRQLREDYPNLPRRWGARLWRGFVPPPDEHQSHRPGRIEISRWKKREPATLPSLERHRLRREQGNARTVIEDLMGRDLTDEELLRVMAVGEGEDNTKLTKREREARLDDEQKGYSSAVEELGGPVTTKRHNLVEIRINTVVQTFRSSEHLSSDTPDVLEELADLNTVKNMCLASWEHGEQAPGYLRDKFVNTLGRWQDRLQANPNIATVELVEDLLRGWYQLHERDLEANGAGPNVHFAADHEYHDRGIVLRDHDGNIITVLFSDGTRRRPDAGAFDPHTNPLGLGPRVRADGSDFVRPEGLDRLVNQPPYYRQRPRGVSGLNRIIAGSHSYVTLDGAERVFALYDQERTYELAAESLVGVRFQVDHFESEARRLGDELANLQSMSSVRPGLIRRTTDEFDTVRDISHELRRRQAWLEGQLQGFVEGFSEPPTLRTRLGQLAVGGPVNRTNERHTDFTPDGDIIWHNGTTVEHDPNSGYQDLRGELTFNPRGRIVNYVPST